jgi:hypothetical protein
LRLKTSPDVEHEGVHAKHSPRLIHHLKKTIGCKLLKSNNINPVKILVLQHRFRPGAFAEVKHHFKHQTRRAGARNPPSGPIVNGLRKNLIFCGNRP